jgi:hypothetical protein
MARPSDLSDAVRSPTAIFLGLFAFLVVFRNALPFDSWYYWLDIGFVCCLAVIVAAIAIPDLLPSYLPRLIVTAVFAGALLTIGFDVALVYVPVPELSPLVSGLPPDRLRLAGLHGNPLASGKFILVSCCMLAAGLIRTYQGQTRVGIIATWSLFVIVAFALVATESKSTILAFLISLGVIALTAFRIETLPLRSLVQGAKVGLSFLAILVIWTVVIAPPIKRHAATAWVTSSYITLRQDLNGLAGLPRDYRASDTQTPPRVPASHLGLLDRFLSELRIGKSFRLRAKTEDLDSPLSSHLDSETTATERDCGVFCTGQRDLLWKAGLEVVQEHWLIGIGYGGWKRVLQQKLGYPFDHPHNGFIEMWGEFGIAGAAIYVALIVFLIRRTRSAILAKVGGFEKWFLIGSSMAMLAFLANELFDTNKFFSLSPHAIWIWPLLALQERYLRQPLTWRAPARWLSFISERLKFPRRTSPLVRASS